MLDLISEVVGEPEPVAILRQIAIFWLFAGIFFPAISWALFQESKKKFSNNGKRRYPNTLRLVSGFFAFMGIWVLLDFIVRWWQLVLPEHDGVAMVLYLAIPFIPYLVGFAVLFLYREWKITHQDYISMTYK